MDAITTNIASTGVPATGVPLSAILADYFDSLEDFFTSIR